MTQVTMPLALGGSGNTYSDDGSSAHDMTSGGHRTNLLPMLTDTVAMANSALASAQSAVNSPGTNGTSVTALTIGTGAQAFTTQTAKSFVVGQSVKIAITASPTNWMLGDITAYNSGTGAMTVNVTAINGSGAASAWTIGLSAPTVSLNYVPYASKTGAYTVLKADMGTLFDCSNASWTLAYTAVATLGANWWGWVYNSGAGTITLDPSGTETINGALTLPVLPGELWLIMCTGAALKAICMERGSLGGSATAPSPTLPYMLWIDTSAAPALLKMRNGANAAWITLGDATQTNLGLLSLTNAQNQTPTAFTTAGTSPNFTATPSPAITALVAGKTRLNLTFNAAGITGSNSLNVSALGALNLKQYDATGTKVAAVVALNQIADVECDGTDWVILDPLPPTSVSPPVRQTVLSGPVDANGFAAFGGSTGSTTVTAAGTLKATCAAGGDANYIGSIVNPSWTGLSTNGTMYLYLDITSAGVVSVGSTALAPVYQWGGTYSVTNLQNTYNIQEMTMKVGNGAAATQVYRVFVGEVTVAGGVVTVITWYALMRRYMSAFTNTLPGTSTAVSFNHNLGTSLLLSKPSLILKCLTTEFGYAVGDLVTDVATNNGSSLEATPITWGVKTVQFATGSGSAFYPVAKGGGGANTLTAANWAYAMQVNAGW